MENKLKSGTYKIKHKWLGVEYKLTVRRGEFKMFEMDDRYIKTTTEQNMREYYDVLEKLPAEKKNFNIAYYVNGKLQETIKLNTTYGIVRAKMKDMKRMNYKQGLLVAVPVK